MARFLWEVRWLQRLNANLFICYLFSLQANSVNARPACLLSSGS